MFSETVTFPAGSRTLQAYFTHPDGPGPFPGVLVIHEIFGLNENIRDIARRFAGEGYTALAVDLFAGRNRVVCMFSLFLGMHFGISCCRGCPGLTGDKSIVDVLQVHLQEGGRTHIQGLFLDPEPGGIAVFFI